MKTIASEKVVFVILTDGQENSSKEFNITQINQMIRHQQEKYAWEFIFLGANQDARLPPARETNATASQMGIGRDNALNYKATGANTKRAFNSVSDGIARYRSGSRSAGFVESDRIAQEDRDE